MRYLVPILLMASVACTHAPTKVTIVPPPGLTEAPAGYDLATNGIVDQIRHDADRIQFEEDAGDELGPVFNHRSCLDCHSNPVTGGNSQVFEHRTNVGAFLVHDQAIPRTQQQVAPVGSVNALRSSLNLFGDGFVEQVPDSLLRYIASVNGGQYVVVASTTGPHVGRFGHKDQEANLLDFAGDADFNEKGVGNRLHPDPQNGIEDQEPTCLGGGEDIDCYARFMRALKAPPRGPINGEVTAGGVIFMHIGCGLCHVPTLYTGLNVFHPFGDFLLHNINTGDHVAQGDAPADKIRTAPLWGLRVKSRFLHDGRVFDIPSAVLAHGHEAKRARNQFKRLNAADRAAVLAFLESL